MQGPEPLLIFGSMTLLSPQVIVAALGGALPCGLWSPRGARTLAVWGPGSATVPLGSDWTYPAPSAQMFLPHVWFGTLRWIVGERCPAWDGEQRSFLQGVCDREPMAGWPFSHHLAGTV